MIEVDRREQMRLEARAQRPLWLQISLGCGATLLVVLGTLAGIGYAVHRKGTAVMSRSWKELRSTTERLQTAESAKALYRNNPGLSEIYPKEAEFLKLVEGWRPKLQRIPEQPPALTVLLKDRQLLQVHENRSDGHATVRITYTFSNGAVLEMESDQGKLTALMLK
jgi:hypothetical protein